MPLIAIEDLQVQKNDTVICDVPRLFVEPGETVAIVGGNGSGKSTLLRVLAGFEREYRGTCRLDLAMREVVFAHQSPYLFRGTSLANVTYGLRARARSPAEYLQIGRHWLDKCGALALADQPAAHLSGGERKRVALARALAVEPKLLLLDEPLEEVDPAGITTICQLLSEIGQTTTVLVTSPVSPPEALSARIVNLAARNPGCA